MILAYCLITGILPLSFYSFYVSKKILGKVGSLAGAKRGVARQVGSQRQHSADSYFSQTQLVDGIYLIAT